MPVVSRCQNRGKVLVVDDDPIVLEVTKAWLESAGYHVDVREQALGTSEQVARESPDVVLLDLSMPAITGSELAQVLRRHSLTNKVAIILYSSSDFNLLISLVRDTGAIGAIAKTSNPTQFMHWVTRRPTVATSNSLQFDHQN